MCPYLGLEELELVIVLFWDFFLSNDERKLSCAKMSGIREAIKDLRSLRDSKLWTVDKDAFVYFKNKKYFQLMQQPANSCVLLKAARSFQRGDVIGVFTGRQIGPHALYTPAVNALLPQPQNQYANQRFIRPVVIDLHKQDEWLPVMRIEFNRHGSTLDKSWITIDGSMGTTGYAHLALHSEVGANAHYSPHGYLVVDKHVNPGDVIVVPAHGAFYASREYNAQKIDTRNLSRAQMWAFKFH